MAGGARRFQIGGTVVVDKIKVSAAAKKALQGLVIEINDKKLVRSLDNASTKINSLADDFKKLGKVPINTNFGSNMQVMAKSIEHANTGLKNQRSIFSQVISKASAFRASTIIINSVVDAIQRSFTAFVAYNKALRDINKIAKLSDDALADVGKRILNVAADYNIAADEALTAFRTISQLGYEDIATQFDIFGKSASIAAASTLDIKDSIKLLVSVAKQANLTFDEAAVRIEKLIALEDASAVDLKDLAEINSKAGTSIAQAFDNAIEGASLFAAIQERTQAGGAVVGTFAKTLIARIGGANKDVVKTFDDLNIQLSEVNGKLKDPIQLLTELKAAIAGLGEQQQENIIGKIFGVRQIELGKAALDTLGDAILKNGRTFEIAAASSNVYFRQLQKVQEEQKSYNAQLNKAKNNLFAFLTDVSTTTVERLIKIFVSLTSTLEGLVNVLPIASKDIVSLFTNFALGAGAAFLGKRLFSTNKPSISTQYSNNGAFALGRTPVAGTEEAFYSKWNPALKGTEPLGSNVRYGVEVAGKVTAELDKLLRNTYLTREGAQKRASALAKQFEGEDIKFNVKEMDLGRIQVRELIPGKLTSSGLKFGSTLTRREVPGFYRGQAAEPFLGEQAPHRAFRSPYPSQYAAPGAPAYSSFQREPSRFQNIGLFKKSIQVIKTKFDAIGKAMDGFNTKTLIASFALTAIAEATEKSTDALGQVVNSSVRWAATLIPFGIKFGLIGAAIGAITTSFGIIKESFEIFNGNLVTTANYLEKLGEVAASEAITEQETARRLQTQANGPQSNQPNKELNTLAGVVNDFIDNISNLKISALSRGAGDEEINKLIREQFTTFFSSINKGFPAASQALTLKSGRQQALFASPKFQSLLTNQDFLNTLNDSLSTGKDVTAAFVDALKKVSPLEQQLINAKKLEGTLSDEEIDDRLKLIKINQDYLNIQYDILKSQLELTNAYSNTSDTIKGLEAALEITRAQTAINIKQEEEYFNSRKQQAVQKYYNQLSDIDIQMLKSTNTLNKLQKELDALTGKEAEAKQAQIDATNQQLEGIRGARAALERHGPVQIMSENDLEKNNALREKTAKGYEEELSIRAKIVQLQKENDKYELDIQMQRKEFSLDLKDSLTSLFAATGNLDKLKEIDRINASNLDKAKLQVEAAKENLRLIEKSGEESKTVLKDFIDSINKDIAVESDKDKIGNLNKRKNILTELLNNPELNKDAKQGREAVVKAEQNLIKVSLDGIARRIEKEKEYWRESLDAAVGLVDVAKNLRSTTKELFQAQASVGAAISNKFNEAADAIKSRRGELSSALDGLASARKSLIDAIRASTASNIEYSLSLAKANIESQKILGVFFGLESEAAALKSAYDAVISSAVAAGASEKQLAQLRLQSAQDQLSIFNELLSKQRSQAEQYFTSTGEDRLKFVQGLNAIQSIVSQFNGNIKNFRGLSETALNQFGASIIALPQELRQNIQSALELLPDNVGIGGLSTAQIKEILQGGVFGKSQALGIEGLSENIQKVADLTKQVVELNTEAQIDNKASVAEASKAVEQAKEQVLIAKLQLIQAENDAINIQHSIGEVNSTLKDEIGALRYSFEVELKKIQATPVTNVADEQQRAKAIADLISKFQGEVAAAYNNLSSVIGSINATSQLQIGTSRGALPQQGNDILQSLTTAFNQSITNLGDRLDKNLDAFKISIDTLAGFSDKLNELGSRFASMAQEKLQATINIDNQTTVRVDGVQQLVDKLLQSVEAEGYASETELNVLEKTLYQVISELFGQGLIDGRFSITGR